MTPRGDPVPARIARRFVLGTVQLGLPYGRRRHAELLSTSDAFAILDAAWQLGVRAFDTAEAYGESAARVRAWLERRAVLGEAHVVTKVPPGADAAAVATAAERFAGVASLTVLSHGPLDATGWSRLLAAADTVQTAAGQSVYTESEVRHACALPLISRVQAPANVLDERALEARGQCPVPLDLRSVFLQGLLLDDPALADQRVRGAGRIAAAVQEAAAATGGSAAALCVAGLLQAVHPEDRLVIGADTPDQLEILQSAWNIDLSAARHFVAGLRRAVGQVETTILDPRTW